MGEVALLWMRLRAELRAEWRAWLGLVALIGIVGAAVLTTAAGAQRTNTAYPRYEQAEHSADVLISPNGSPPPSFYAAIKGLPEVASVATVALANLATRNITISASSLVAVSSQMFITINRPKVLDGQLFDQHHAEEVMVDPQYAASQHLKVGSTVLIRITRFSRTARGAPPTGTFAGRFRVAAIVVFYNQVVPVTQFDEQPQIAFTVAFFHQYQRFGGAVDGVFIRLRPGFTTGELNSRVLTVARGYPMVHGVLFNDLRQNAATVERAIEPETVALLLFSLFLGIIALAVVGQLLIRQVGVEAIDYLNLRALGMTQGQLALLSLARVSAIAFVGGLAAVAGAILASPLMPIGPARLAEPRPGIDVDLALLGIGEIVIVGLLVLFVAPTAWRLAASRPSAGKNATQGTRRWLHFGSGAMASASIGVQMAFDSGSQQHRVPIWSSLVGTAISVAAITTALVFGTSLTHLLNTPVSYGQTWDIEFGTAFKAFPQSFVTPLVHSIPGVRGYSGVDLTEIVVNGRTVPGIGVDELHGSVFPTLLSGRAPRRDDEIVLGRRTAAELNVHVGQDVKTVISHRLRNMDVVGEAVFASFGEGSFTPTNLGDGAAVTASVVATPPAIGTGRGYNFLLLRLRSERSLGVISQRLTQVAVAHGCPVGSCAGVTNLRPANIANYARVRFIPLLLGSLLALLSVGTIAHVLITSIRMRRREFAVLKTIGFVRRQVSATIAWQATSLTAGALVIGLPLGIIVGRAVWGVFAHATGVSGDVTIPGPEIGLVILIALVVANVVAFGPGRSASLVRPAVILRDE